MAEQIIDKEKFKEDLSENKQKYAERRKQVVERVSNDVGRSMEDLMLSMKGLQKSIDTKIQDYKESPQSQIALDLINTPENYYLKINVAGVEKENIDIESTEREIIINLEFQNTMDDIEEEKEEAEYMIQNLETGKIKRIVKLPETIKFKEISAKYALGTVILTIPKLDIEKHKVDLS